MLKIIKLLACANRIGMVRNIKRYRNSASLSSNSEPVQDLAEERIAALKSGLKMLTYFSMLCFFAHFFLALHLLIKIFNRFSG